jgi:hypothetical protein
MKDIKLQTQTPTVHPVCYSMWKMDEQGERGYKNQVVLRGDTIIAVDGRCAREVSIHTLHGIRV